jgi:hypothetical protein
MADETFVHEIKIEARHRAADGSETVERVHAELTHDKADPLRAAEHVFNAAKAMCGEKLHEIDETG